MTLPSESSCAWSAATVARLNARFGVQHDDDVSLEDWPAAMGMPSLVGAALQEYDRADAGADTRALLIELLLNTFEFCSVERDGNPDWRGTLDRIERDFAEHRDAVQRWADPDDGVPWIISEAMQALLAGKASRG